MKYDGVFFDLDGTVIDSLQNITDAVNYTMRHFGMAEYSAAELRPVLGNGVGVLMCKIMPPDIADTRIQQLLDFYRPYYARHSTECGPFEGILPMLERLKSAGLVLAIISNKPDSAVQPLGERYFKDYVRLYVGEREDVRRKPWPDMLEKAAEALHVDLSRCLYVGDSEVDIDTANNAGIDCACVTWGFRTRQELIDAGARIILDTPEALAAFVLGTDA